MSEQANESIQKTFKEAVYGREIYRAPAPKPCPFCGAENDAQICHESEADADCCDVYVAVCTCGVSGPPGGSQLEAAERWNQRRAA
jgi:hypothetical protein